MSKSRNRESSVTFSKDQKEIADHEIARCFDHNEGRLFFARCEEGKRFAAVVTAVTERTRPPLGVKPRYWRQLVWLRLTSFEHQGVLQYGRRGNVVWMSPRRMEAMVSIADSRRESHGRPRASRHARRDDYNNRSKQTSAVH